MKDDSQQLIQDRIRELRESTDFVSTLLESPIGYAIIAADFDGNVIAFNEGARQIYGYTPEEVIGKQSIELFFPRDFVEVGKLQEIIGNLIEKESLSYEGEKVRKNGESFPAQILFTLRKDKSGKVVGFIEIAEDLTERKRAQEAKFSELESLSYSIAHSLKSPLISIQGLLSYLREDIRNQEIKRVQEDVHLIESAVRKMDQLVKGTLEYFRTGYQVKPTMNVPFGKIVEEVITGFAEQVRSIGATVSLAKTFPTVYVDRMRMVQVVSNLIQNSINYRDKTMPLKIEIGHWLSKGEVVFFVHDNGLGIDASEAEKVFALFYRGTADGEGSGAGLAIVKKIIEAHGGRIWVQDQSGKGTTMCFALPQQRGTNKEDNNGKD